jgi:phenylpyruvate tautomerase PptA (4-oxalocrotonate tautomerase family)
MLAFDSKLTSQLTNDSEGSTVIVIESRQPNQVGINGEYSWRP